MTSKDSNQDQELLDRYRRASDTDATAPSDAVRSAILAESRSVAEQLAAKELPPAPFDVSRPAANDSRWKITAFGTAGAALLAALLIAPRYWESLPPAQQRTATATAPTAAPAAAPPKLESIAPSQRSESQGMAELHENAGAGLPNADRAARARPARERDALEPVTLQSASAAGNLAQTTLLLDQGAAVDARDTRGRTPLLLAVAQNRLSVVRLLLARGADPNAADNAGLTPLQQAKDKDLRDVAALLQQAGAR